MTTNYVYIFLTSVRKIEAEIQKLTIRHDELQTCLLPGAIRYDGDRVQTSPDDKMSEIAAEVVDLERQIQELRLHKFRKVGEIADAVRMLGNDDEQMVLMGYYVGRLPMARVAELIHQSTRSAYYIRRRAVQHLAEKFSQIAN